MDGVANLHNTYRLTSGLRGSTKDVGTYGTLRTSSQHEIDNTFLPLKTMIGSYIPTYFSSSEAAPDVDFKRYDWMEIDWN